MSRPSAPGRFPRSVFGVLSSRGNTTYARERNSTVIRIVRRSALPWCVSLSDIAVNLGRRYRITALPSTRRSAIDADSHTFQFTVLTKKKQTGLQKVQSEKAKTVKKIWTENESMLRSFVKGDVVMSYTLIGVFFRARLS